MKNFRNFHLKVLVVKFSIYLNRRVFVMVCFYSSINNLCHEDIQHFLFVCLVLSVISTKLL